MTTNIDLMTDICQQRRRRQLFNIPMVRAELIANPYESNFTKTQLDMRRKVEILKYSSNRQSSQTNNLSKKQFYSSKMNKNYFIPLRNINEPILITNINCPDDDKIHTSTSSCDVPGPIMTLYYDEKVPLYNFKSDFDTRAYAIIQEENNIPWSIIDISENYIITNASNQSEKKTFATIYFRQNMDTIGATNFKLTTPITLSVVFNPVSSNKYNLQFSITKIIMDIYYNQTLVNNKIITNFPTISDVSFNNISIETTQSLQTTKSLKNLYIGYLEIPKIPFDYRLGYIYDFYFTFYTNVIITDNIGIVQDSSILQYTNTITVNQNITSTLMTNTDNIIYHINPNRDVLNAPSFSLVLDNS